MNQKRTDAFEIRVGESFSWNGSWCSIVEMNGNAVVIQDVDRRLQRIHYAELLRPVIDGGRARFPGVSESAEHAPLALVWEQLSDADREDVHQRAEHVREVLTGYKSGTASHPQPGEPRPEYASDVPKMQKYRAKALELGISVRTLSAWIARYNNGGEIALSDWRRVQPTSGLANLDPRWVDMARTIIDEQTNESKVPEKVIMQRIAARLTHTYGPDAVKIPSRSVRYRALKDLDWGRNTFTGSTKAKRSNANKPQGTYGRLSPTRPGEYILMDSTRSDVFAFDAVSGGWLNSELTVAMGLYDRAIVGMRLTPTTRSLDVAGVLLEAMTPYETPKSWGTHAEWPYHGVPQTLIVAEGDDKIKVARFQRASIPETIIIDHGKPYMSEHVMSVCARLGISVQPARVYMPTDKAAVERFFRTIKELLAQLPGYKGEDQPARGVNPENDAVYTIQQLEGIIREWIATIYHVRPHSELSDPGLPGVALSPQQRYEQGIAIAGRLRLPHDRNIVLEMLPVVRRTIQRYGVEYETLRYKGDVLKKHRNRSQSLYRDRRDWPFFVNPDDLRYIYFHDPDDNTWHTLEWDRAGDVGQPFGIDALEFAKKLAVSDPDIPDTEAALTVLLGRWGSGQHLTPQERRASARQTAAHHRDTPGDDATSLRVVQDLIARHQPETMSASDELEGGWVITDHEQRPTSGDDDLDGELDPTEFEAAENFYATALEDL